MTYPCLPRLSTLACRNYGYKRGPACTLLLTIFLKMSLLWYCIYMTMLKTGLSLTGKQGWININSDFSSICSPVWPLALFSKCEIWNVSERGAASSFWVGWWYWWYNCMSCCCDTCDNWSMFGPDIGTMHRHMCHNHLKVSGYVNSADPISALSWNLSHSTQTKISMNISIIHDTFQHIIAEVIFKWFPAAEFLVTKAIW